MQKLPLNWVDAIVIILLIVGLFHGKRRGMSNELLGLFQWLLIVVLAALYYEPVSLFVRQQVNTSPLFTNVIAYLAIALGIKIIFTVIKRLVGEKLVGSDIFGRLEFILGMGAGMVRYACMILAVMALVNAPYVSRQTLEESLKKQTEVYGSDFFPTFAQIQFDIFVNSMSGKFVKNNLANQLISPFAHYVPEKKGPTAAKKREAEVDEAIGGKK